jgi:hypothetical protein
MQSAGETVEDILGFTAEAAARGFFAAARTLQEACAFCAHAPWVLRNVCATGSPKI